MLRSSSVSLCFLLSLLVVMAIAQPVSLNDHRIASSSSPQSLDGAWKVTSPSQSLSFVGTVPGDIINDLFHAGRIGDPIYELNFKNGSIWDDHDFNYENVLPLKGSLKHSRGHFDQVFRM